MKTLPLLVILLSSTAAVAGERAPTPAAPPLQPVSECLVPDEVRDWGVVDKRRLVVETLGERYYDIKLSFDCSDLQTRPRISFRNGASNGSTTLAKTAGADGERICGDINDAVVPHGSEPPTGKACDIAQIRRIDKATYEGVFGKPAEEGNALLDAVIDASAQPLKASID